MGKSKIVNVGDTVVFKNIDNWSYSRIWFSRYDRHKYSESRQVVKLVDGKYFKILGTNAWFDKQWIESVEENHDLIIKN